MDEKIATQSDRFLFSLSWFMYVLIIALSFIPPPTPLVELLLGPFWLYFLFPIAIVILVVFRSYKKGGFTKGEMIVLGGALVFLAAVIHVLIEIQVDAIASLCGGDPKKYTLVTCLNAYYIIKNSVDISSLAVAAFGLGLLLTGVVTKIEIKGGD